MASGPGCEYQAKACTTQARLRASANGKVAQGAWQSISVTGMECEWKGIFSLILNGKEFVWFKESFFCFRDIQGLDFV
jgi:hypothetical protein